ncbi:unnamed protein product [Closterium sp. NIES-54]
MARVWGCMAQFLVPEQQRGGKMRPKARWGLHLGVSAESKGWEILDIADNRVVTTSDVVFYENMSLEVWKSEHGPVLGRTPTTPPTDTLTVTLPLLAEVGEPPAEDVEDVSSPSPSPAPPVPPLVAELRRLTLASASGDEGSSGASPKAPTKSIAGGHRDVQQVDMRVLSMLAGEEQTEEVQPTMVKSAKGATAQQQLTWEQAAAKPTTEHSATGQSAGEPTLGEQSAGTPTVVQQDAEGSDDRPTSEAALKTPLSVNAYAKVTFDDEEAQEGQEEEYWQKAGSLQFAETTTRPDIAFACSKLGSGLTLRSDQQWREVDRCLAYLANTRGTALEFGGGPESQKLVGYVDAGDKKKQNEHGWLRSEYVAATKAAKEGRRLRFLFAEFRQQDAGTPTVLTKDNKLAIMVAEGMGLTGNLKHMERRQAWLQHMVKDGKFSLQYIPTAEQPADFLTKALHYPAFNRCSVAISKVRLADVGDGRNDVQQ